jgi:uncharacterized membrane protein
VLWTCYRSATIDGVQGRYFIPLALLVLMLMHARCKWRVGSQATTLLVAGYLVATLVTVFQYFYRWRS